MVLVRSFVSANDLITSTTCAQSIDFGMSAIAMMEDGEGRLGVMISIEYLQKGRLVNDFGGLTAFILIRDEVHCTLNP